MKKSILFIISAILILFTPSIYANWVDPGSCTLSGATDVTGSTGVLSFPKVEGKKSLCLKQLNKINYYSTIFKNIIIDGQSWGCYINYTVNGVPWDGKNAIPINQWVMNGAYNCYETSRPDPTATYDRWDLYHNEYWYDKSNPLCGSVSIYTIKNDSSSRISYTWWWINKELFARVQCSDYYSWCPKESDNITNISSDYYPLSHEATKIDVSFKDIVNNQGTQTCNIEWTYLYDPTEPKIQWIIDDLWTDIIDTGSTHNYFAWPRKWKITTVDPYENWDLWISWIKSIQAEIFRIKDTYNTPVNNIKVCDNTQLYPPSNDTSADIEDLTLDCSNTSWIQVAWTYNLIIDIEDYAGNKIHSIRTIFVSPNKNLMPTFKKSSYEVIDTWVIPSTNIFANKEDYYKYELNLVDSYKNPIHGKDIKGFEHIGSWIYLNDIEKTGWSALIFDHTNQYTKTDKSGNIWYFILKSYVGGFFWEQFRFSISDWNKWYEDIWVQDIVFSGSLWKFSKLFTASMVLWDDETDIVFWQKQSLNFELYRHDKAGNFISNAEINFIDSLKGTPYNTWNPTNTSYSWTSESVSEGFISINNTNKLAATGTVLFIPEILVRFTWIAGIESRPAIRYEFDGKNIAYYVSDRLDSTDPLTLNGWEINSIYIWGYEQSQGKWEFVSNKWKMGKNTWATIRNTITKNAALLTRNRSVNDSIMPNGVKYVSGDQILWGEVDWNTLIISDGNLTINENFNTKNRNIGIILLNNKDLSKSNVYIKPNVAFISSMIYADWSIQSVDWKGNIFPTSNKARSTTLWKQIVFYGGLYTRNTIGWAILGWSNEKYLLPGWVTTEDIQEAIRYDLSFLRMKGIGYDDINWTKKYNGWHKDSVVVFINEVSQENPPPGFEK